MKYLCVLLSLILLLSLSACVDAKAEGGSPSSAQEEETISALPEKSPVDIIAEKIPLDTEEISSEGKDFTIVGSNKAEIELFPIATDSTDGEIPMPEPVEPPVEEKGSTIPSEDK